MARPDLSIRKPSKSVRVPHWIALILLPVLFLLAHVAVPRELSVISKRHGWAHGRPGRRNLPGLLLIGIGTVGLIWCARLHVVASPGPIELERTPRYLLVRGPYQFTRNPMYLSGIAIWLGWLIFYGSVAVLVGLVVLWGSVTLLLVPSEERALEARFGEAYLRYKHTVPRWVGKTRRSRDSLPTDPMPAPDDEGGLLVPGPPRHH
jgi:protein-S-isoprenylcysteine O-methyltransferase Ste14